MKSFEKNSKKAFIVTIIVYLIYKIYNAIHVLNNGLENIPGGQEELKAAEKGGTVFVVITAIVSTVLFIFLTYKICKWIFNKINVDNPKMLERFSGIYFANMTVLYIFSIILLLLTNYLPDTFWVRFVLLGLIKVLIAAGLNLLLLDKEEDSEIRTVPNIILYSVVFLF